MNPVREFLDTQGWMVLDAGLATSLEAKGADLDDDLWSAKLLLESPGLVEQVHREFLAAGADCITSSTYQATFEGFRRRGLSDTESVALFELSVGLAGEARDAFWADPVPRRGRLKPLVGASIGPYGAFLADGSEYSGDYGLTEDELYAFHRRRWRLLAGSAADLLCCETIPSLTETRALLRLLDETTGRWAWMSFSCRDEACLNDGTSLADAVRLCDARANVAAVGINCTAPALISSLVSVARARTDKPIVVYPNSGELYDGRLKSWSAEPPATDWVESAREWLRLGAGAIGGCCRTDAEDIAHLRRLLEASAASKG